jgi:hypothetical protein
VGTWCPIDILVASNGLVRDDLDQFPRSRMWPLTLRTRLWRNLRCLTRYGTIQTDEYFFFLDNAADVADDKVEEPEVNVVVTFLQILSKIGVFLEN